MRSCKLPSGAQMPVFGLGTWRMGESGRRRAQELDAVKYALELGYPMIDTAEMYGDGERRGDRRRGAGRAAPRPFIVSKVYPHNATRSRHDRGLRAQPQAPAARAHRPLPAALARRRAARGDLRGVPSPARGREDRRLRRQQLRHRRHGRRRPPRQGAERQSNQVLYCLSRRGPEFDLLPWMRKRSIPLMAYSPLDQGGLLGKAPLQEDRRRGRLHAGATGDRLAAGPARRGHHPEIVDPRAGEGEFRRARRQAVAAGPGRARPRLPAAESASSRWRCSERRPTRARA